MTKTIPMDFNINDKSPNVKVYELLGINTLNGKEKNVILYKTRSVVFNKN